jgi:hypothetical protein
VGRRWSHSAVSVSETYRASQQYKRE